MYLVAITWLFIALLMALAEATASNGSVLGAIVTFLLYGLGPVSIVLYVLGTPARKARLRLREQADEGGHAAAARSVAAEREEA